MVRGVDIKKDDWYQVFENAENFFLDMSLKENCLKMTERNRRCDKKLVIWEVWVL